MGLSIGFCINIVVFPFVRCFTELELAMSRQSPKFLVFPLAYVILDTLLVLFIKGSSANGHTSYNTATANAITECLKLSISLYYVHSENLWGEFNKISLSTVMKFGVSNLMYALNNNLFHYCIGALPPALFVVSINALRTLLTSCLQPFVSGKMLTRNQVIACILLTLSFIFASMKDITEVIYTNSFKGSSFALLIFFASLYSSISVSASLAQEKLLKESFSLMVANVINYSIGITLQTIAMIYFKSTTNIPVFRGFDNFWVQMIPVTMTLSGLSISFVLRYFDNIVKLMCSSLCVLIVHAVTAYVSNQPIFSFSFLCGWFLTIPASYLYYGTSSVPAKSEPKPECDDSSSKPGAENEEQRREKDHESASNSKKAPLINRFSGRYLPLGIVVAALTLSASLSSFDWAMSKAKVSLFPPTNIEDSCPLYEVPATDSQNAKNTVRSYTSKYTQQFVHVDPVSQKLISDCPLDRITVLPADVPGHEGNWRPLTLSREDGLSASRRLTDAVTQSVLLGHHLPEQAAVASSFHRFIRRRVLANAASAEIPWNLLFGGSFSNLPYVWLSCDLLHDVNLVARPPLVQPAQSTRLNEKEASEIKEYVEKWSVPLPTAASGEIGVAQPIFDSIVILYLDAVSSSKFEAHFPKSFNFLQSLSGEADSTHRAVQLSRLHSLGINSNSNYPPFFAGLSAQSSSVFDHKPAGNSTRAREAWLFDIAEQMGFATLAGQTGCQDECTSNCYAKQLRDPTSWESGGFYRQYMQDSDLRFPGQYNWPGAASCEPIYRSSLNDVSCSTCADRVDKRLWLGNRHSMPVALDWLSTWLAANRGVNQQTKLKTFAALVLEDTHVAGSSATNFDDVLEGFLKRMLTGDGSSVYGLQNAAFMVLSDHGMHFGPEYRNNAGKVANKLPFGYVIVPRSYFLREPQLAENLLHNSNALVTPYDLRATVLHWLTGREWSAKVVAGLDKQRFAANGRHINSNIDASSFGNGLLTTRLNLNRGCAEAGISETFCGCNLKPCSSSLEKAIAPYFPEIVARMNAAIASYGVGAVSTCKPVTVDELRYVPGQSNNCLTNRIEGSNAAHLLIANLVVSRNNMMLGVYFSVQPDGKLTLQDVTTISTYAGVWQTCAAEFESKSIAITLHDSVRQFCYCESANNYWMSVLLDVIRWFP